MANHEERGRHDQYVCAVAPLPAEHECAHAPGRESQRKEQQREADDQYAEGEVLYLRDGEVEGNARDHADHAGCGADVAPEG